MREPEGSVCEAVTILEVTLAQQEPWVRRCRLCGESGADEERWTCDDCFVWLWYCYERRQGDI